MFDRSLIDKSCTLADYWFLHDDPEMRWHRGRALLRERLEARSKRPPNETKGEKTRWRLMNGARNFVLPDRQHWLTLPSGRRVRYDFAYIDRLLAIEVDEYEGHGDDVHFGSDRRRGSDCALVGWSCSGSQRRTCITGRIVLATIRAHYELRGRVGKEVSI